jgi:hypothetical protein
MRVPGRSRARLEGDQAAGGVDVLVGRPDRIDSHPAGEVFGRAGGRCLLAGARDLLHAVSAFASLRLGGFGSQGQGGVQRCRAQGKFEECVHGFPFW